MSDELSTLNTLEVTGSINNNRGLSQQINFQVNSSIYILDIFQQITSGTNLNIIYNSIDDISKTYTYGTGINFLPAGGNQIVKPDFNTTYTFTGNIDIPYSAFSGHIKQINIGNTYRIPAEDNLEEVVYYGWAQAPVEFNKDETTALQITLNLNFIVNPNSNSSIYFYNKELSSIINLNAFPTPCPNFIAISGLDLNNLDDSLLDNGKLQYQIPITANLPTISNKILTRSEIKCVIENTKNSTSRENFYYLTPNQLNYGLPRTLIFGQVGAKSMFNNTTEYVSTGEERILYPVGYYTGEETTFCCLPEGLSGAELVVNGLNINNTWTTLDEVNLIAPNSESYNESNNSIYYANNLFGNNIWVPNDGTDRICGDKLIFNSDNLPNYVRAGNISVSMTYKYKVNSVDKTFNISASKYKVTEITYPDDETDPLTGTLEVYVSAPSTRGTNYYINQGEQNIIPSKMYDPHILLFSKNDNSKPKTLADVGVKLGNSYNEGTIIYCKVSLNGNFYKGSNTLGYLRYSLTIKQR